MKGYEEGDGEEGERYEEGRGGWSFTSMASSSWVIPCTALLPLRTPPIPPPIPMPLVDAAVPVPVPVADDTP